MNIQLTAHALKRGHQRLSLKRRAIQRTAELALKRGNPTYRNECIDPWLLSNQPTITSGREIRIYGNAYYVFEYSRTSISLITIMLANGEKGGNGEYSY